MSQISLEEIMKSEFRQREHSFPWFLQVSSAPLLKFTGDVAASNAFENFHPTRLKKGTFGFINGSRAGDFDSSFRSRSQSCYVNYMDLEPMKVTEFTEEEKEMKYPESYTVVEVIDNSAMAVVDAGWLTILLPDKCCIKDRLPNGEFSKSERWHDLRVHHFKGFKPKRLLVWKDDVDK